MPTNYKIPALTSQKIQAETRSAADRKSKEKRSGQKKESLKRTVDFSRKANLTGGCVQQGKGWS